MKQRTLLFIVLAMALNPCWAGKVGVKAEARLENAADVLHEILDAPDKGIPKEVLESAKCIAVIPRQIRAGFVVAATRGKGVATCRTENGWSAPAFFTITGGGWGVQIGLDGRSARAPRLRRYACCLRPQCKNARSSIGPSPTSSGRRNFPGRRARGRVTSEEAIVVNG